MILGIDVSHHQGEIDWSRVRNAGIQFAYIKATESINYNDPMFIPNVINATKAGIVVGAYHFLHPSSTHTSIDEAAHFLRAIRNDAVIHRLTLPPAIDTESVYEDTKRMTRAQIAQFTINTAVIVQDSVQQTPIIYTGEWYLGGYMGRLTELARYPLWLSSYRRTPPSAPAPWPDWAIWQYTSSARIPGIQGKVDRNEARASWYDPIIGPKEPDDMADIPDPTIPKVVAVLYDLIVNREPSTEDFLHWCKELDVHGTDGFFRLVAGLADERAQRGL